MRHFVVFVAVVFSTLFLAYLYRDEGQSNRDLAGVKVYGANSFIGSWGPGPQLKEIFEKQTGYKIIYVEMSDPAMTFQKMAFDGPQAMGDVILSLDQYDLVRAEEKIKWKQVASQVDLQLSKDLEALNGMDSFLAYDWAPLAFIARSDLNIEIKSLDDLLKPELKGRIALQDPRTSSPGLQFLSWIMRSKSETDAVNFISAMQTQAHSFSPSWSAAYGLFKNKQVDVVLSYVTSPIYHLIEEKDSQYRALEFKEGHPIQVEFAGVPATCQNCDAGIKFVQFLQTPEAQKIIMARNYMLPIYKQAKESTAFDTIKVFQLLKFSFPHKEDIQKWLGIWSEVRKNEG